MIPYVFTLEEMQQHLLEQGDEPSAEDIEIAGCRIGRSWYPALVMSLYDEGLLTSVAAAQVVPSAWNAVEFPSLALRYDDWRALFDLAGYTVEGKAAERPSTPIRLWRGAIPEHRTGWSWTDDRDLAQWFADRPHNSGRGAVWRLDAEPGRLLARIREQRPGESEYVVDVRGLEPLADSVRTRATS